LIKPDYTQAIMWIEKAACQQFVAAQSLLARLYYTGRGVPQNNILAYAWWTMANQNPNPYIQVNIDQVTRKMSVEEIEQAVKLADYFRVSLPQGCGAAQIRERTAMKGARYNKGAEFILESTQESVLIEQ